MCCKVYRIPVLNKQEGKWCAHCAIGSGCRIYEDRPEQCRSFVCLWLQDVTMPPEWKPEISKMVLSIYPTTGFIYAQVDPGTPFAWRKEPYFSRLKAMAEHFLKEGRHLLVFVNGNATLIMPTGPVPIGPMSPEDGFESAKHSPPKGRITLRSEWRARVRVSFRAPVEPAALNSTTSGIGTSCHFAALLGGMPTAASRH